MSLDIQKCYEHLLFCGLEFRNYHFFPTWLSFQVTFQFGILQLKSFEKHLILKDSNYVLLNLNSFLSFSFQRGIPLTIVKFYQMFWAVYMFFVAFRVFLFSSLGTESRSS
jgi:hypothetical protein